MAGLQAQNNSSSLHLLLLLADSALPLGSFAFSSGLESFLAHQKQRSTVGKLTGGAQPAGFDAFLVDSVNNAASTALPYVLAAWRNPTTLVELNDTFDASTPCTVARRASIAQGRALVALWERAFSNAVVPDNYGSVDVDETESRAAARQAIDAFAAALKAAPPSAVSATVETTPSDFFNAFATPQAHLAPLFGTVARALGLSAYDAANVFLLNHAKAVLSAAVRANVLGPYQAQAILAGGTGKDKQVLALQEVLRRAVEREKERTIEDAAVCVPMMDLWIGRHEILYSRIFNS